MGNLMDDKIVLRVKQQLEVRKAYGPSTYELIARSTGLRYHTVSYCAKRLIAEGKIKLSEFKPDKTVRMEEYSMPKQEQPTDVIGISIQAKREYIKKMLKRKDLTNQVLINSYIKYCRDNLNTKNLTIEDFNLLADLITSDIKLATADNIKLGVLGYIRVNKIGEAKKFFEKASIEVLRNLRLAPCTTEELDNVERSLRDYEERLKVYRQLQLGYPVEVIMQDTKLSENEVTKMENAIKQARQAKQGKNADEKSELGH